MAQIGRLLDVASIGARDCVLELGCGNGALAKHISETSGAHVTGIDYIPESVRQAQGRRGPGHLAFLVADIGSLPFDRASFDTMVSVDTLYFTDLTDTIGQVKAVLKPGGQMAILYSHGAEPGVPIDSVARETLFPDRTPLGQALDQHQLSFHAWDLTQEDYRHAQLKKQVIEELRSDLEAEGNLFLYENRHAEAEGVMAAIEAGAHTRYLYRVEC
jgi:ubiquinone/menaquinone biosynthesis C-methylase UbiE